MRLIESGQLCIRRWIEHISSVVLEKILDIEFTWYQISKDFETHSPFQFPQERSLSLSVRLACDFHSSGSNWKAFEVKLP